MDEDEFVSKATRVADPGSHIARTMCTPMLSESIMRSSREATSPRRPSVRATHSRRPDTSSWLSSAGLNETAKISKPAAVLLVERSAAIRSLDGSDCSSLLEMQCTVSPSAKARRSLLALSNERTTAPVLSSERSSRACGPSLFGLRSKEPGRSARREASKSVTLKTALVALNRLSSTGSASLWAPTCDRSRLYVEKIVSTKPASASVRKSSARWAPVTLRTLCSLVCSPLTTGTGAATRSGGADAGWAAEPERGGGIQVREWKYGHKGGSQAWLQRWPEPEAAGQTGHMYVSACSTGPSAEDEDENVTSPHPERRGVSAAHCSPRTAPAPAPQSQKKRERRE